MKNLRDDYSDDFAGGGAEEEESDDIKIDATLLKDFIRLLYYTKTHKLSTTPGYRFKCLFKHPVKNEFILHVEWANGDNYYYIKLDFNTMYEIEQSIYLHLMECFTECL